jgi:DNA-binding MarR family transcriptional regulator
MSYSIRAETAELADKAEAMLTALARHDGPMATKPLARKIHVASSTVTYSSRELIKRGLVERGPNRGNQWSYRVTGDGRALVALLDEAENPPAAPAPVETNGSAEPWVETALWEAAKTTREQMEADVWIWANAITPKGLAEMPRGPLTLIWEATR